jgi:hypothetical protein
MPGHEGREPGVLDRLGEGRDLLDLLNAASSRALVRAGIMPALAHSSELADSQPMKTLAPGPCSRRRSRARDDELVRARPDGLLVEDLRDRRASQLSCVLARSLSCQTPSQVLAFLAFLKATYWASWATLFGPQPCLLLVEHPLQRLDALGAS